jgi:pimeloyl-ACP methyl ester carboxylesterase
MNRHVMATTLLVAFLSTPALAQDQFFDSNGVRIRFVEKGTGEPVLLIHGYTRNLETNWVDAGVFENLARDHHVIAFDLRGHGKSGKPHDPGAYGREFVQDALRLLDHLQIRRAHIVGYSLGATIAAKLLTTDPGRFLTVTLGASGGSRNWVPEDDQIGERNAAELEGDAPFRRLVIALTPLDEPKRTDADIRAQSEAWAAMNDIKALAAYNRGGMRELEATDEEMSAVKVPVLGVVGSVDAALRGLKELQTILPSMRLVVIDGATHAGERSAARRPGFVDAIREFIASHRQIDSR